MLFEQTNHAKIVRLVSAFEEAFTDSMMQEMLFQVAVIVCLVRTYLIIKHFFLTLDVLLFNPKLMLALALEPVPGQFET